MYILFFCGVGVVEWLVWSQLVGLQSGKSDGILWLMTLLEKYRFQKVLKDHVNPQLTLVFFVYTLHVYIFFYYGIGIIDYTLHVYI